MEPLKLDQMCKKEIQFQLRLWWPVPLNATFEHAVVLHLGQSSERNLHVSTHAQRSP